ncbi:MAG: hypothetical protein HY731_14015 [Candidatus Tectomicrobia bacterium]|nr:hypothetical protein [Candidatus Tectomicrobia bacterium]
MVKKFLTSVGLLAFGVILAFLLFEAGVRIFFPQSTVFHRPDPLLGHRGIPKRAGRFVGKEFSVPVTMNAHGFRDHDYSYAKGEGVFRIVVLGDSMTEAMQVPLEKTFPKLLEEKLKSNGVRQFEVISLALSDFGTAQEYLMLKQYGLQYSPDLVILAFMTGNDVRNNSLLLERETGDESRLRRPFFTLNHEELTLMNANFLADSPWVVNFVKQVLREHFQSYMALRERILVVFRSSLFSKRINASTQVEDPPKAQIIAGDYQIYQVRYTPEWEEAWEITTRLILKMKDLAYTNGARFLVMSLTNKEQLNPHYWKSVRTTYRTMEQEEWDLDKPDHILKEFLESAEISYLQLLPEFKRLSSSTDKTFHWEFDGHWNPDGHQLAAELLYNYLLQSHLIDLE